MLFTGKITTFGYQWQVFNISADKFQDMQTKRQLQVGEVIKRNFSEVLIQNGYFIYGEAIVSVTNVLMSSDLGIAKIYLSIFNTPDKNGVLSALKEHIHKLRNELNQKIRKQLRKMPHLQLYIDDTIDEMYKVDELFARLNVSSEEE